MKKKITNSIWVLAALVTTVVIAHLCAILEYTANSITIPVKLLMTLFTIISFIQLYYNFKQFLSIDNIKMQIIVITITYALLYLFGLMMTQLKMEGANKNMYTNYGIWFIVLMIIVAIAGVLFIIQYIMLAIKLIRNKNYIEVRRLGHSMLAVIIFFVFLTFLILITHLKTFVYITLLVELLPLSFLFLIYWKLLKADADGKEAVVK